MIVQATEDKYVLYFDTKSETYFAGIGPTLFNHNPDNFFRSTVVCTTTPFPIEDEICVRVISSDNEYKFYSYPEKNLSKVLECLYKHHEGTVSLSKERFEQMLADRKKLVLYTVPGKIQMDH